MVRFTLLLLSTVFFISCQSQTSKVDASDSENINDKKRQEPNYNYSIQVPQGWTIRDTITQGLKVKFITSPILLKNDNPHGNILIGYMEEKDLEEFTTQNIRNLEAGLPVVIQERGKFKTESVSGQYFTYILESNGLATERIFYIVPVNDYAYMFTFGTRKGTMKKYRNVFDKIVLSFKH